MDVDADAEEKLPALFSFTLDFKVSNEERPSREQPPWEGENATATSPLTPFSGQEEMEQTLQAYGE